MRESPDISIVLLTWNQKRYLEKGLPSLFAALSPEVKHKYSALFGRTELDKEKAKM